METLKNNNYTFIHYFANMCLAFETMNIKSYAERCSLVEGKPQEAFDFYLLRNKLFNN